jgi:hypothetical protein
VNDTWALACGVLAVIVILGLAALGIIASWQTVVTG